MIGAHARGFNPGSVGVALLGDFSGGAQPTGAAVDALVGVLAWKADRHGIDPHGADAYTRSDGSQVAFPNLAGHRDVGQTACPGDRLYERLPEIRDRVAVAMQPRSRPRPAGSASAASSGPRLLDGDRRRAGAGPRRRSRPGGLDGVALAAPVVGMAATPGGGGYWLAAADGGVFAFGDAPFLGAATGRFSAPAVQLEPTPSGRGYWVVSAAGEVEPFGDAAFLGCHRPAVAGRASGPRPGAARAGQWRSPVWPPRRPGRATGWRPPTGVSSAFGDALTRGATPGRAVVRRRRGGETGRAHRLHRRPSRRPGILVARRRRRRLRRRHRLLREPWDRKRPPEAIQLRVTRSGEGYYVAGSDGAVYAFGDADHRREAAGGGPGCGGSRPAERPGAIVSR